MAKSLFICQNCLYCIELIFGELEIIQGIDIIIQLLYRTGANQH